MTKEEAIKQIREHLLAIRAIAKEYGTDDYLILVLSNDEHGDYISFSNSYYQEGTHSIDGLGINYSEWL